MQFFSEFRAVQVLLLLYLSMGTKYCFCVLQTISRCRLGLVWSPSAMLTPVISSPLLDRARGPGQSLLTVCSLAGSV